MGEPGGAVELPVHRKHGGDIPPSIVPGFGQQTVLGGLFNIGARLVARVNGSETEAQMGMVGRGFVWSVMDLG